MEIKYLWFWSTMMCILCAVICHFTGAFKSKFFNVGLLHKVAVSLVENKIVIKSKALQS